MTQEVASFPLTHITHTHIHTNGKGRVVFFGRRGCVFPPSSVAAIFSLGTFTLILKADGKTTSHLVNSVLAQNLCSFFYPFCGISLLYFCVVASAFSVVAPSLFALRFTTPHSCFLLITLSCAPTPLESLERTYAGQSHSGVVSLPSHFFSSSLSFRSIFSNLTCWNVTGLCYVSSAFSASDCTAAASEILWGFVLLS
eukprot:RCo026478